MAYQSHWYIEKRVIYYRVYGVATIDDIHNMNRETHEFVEQGIPLVHIVVDVKAVEKFPTNLAGVRQNLKEQDADQMGWILICGAGNPILRFITSLISQFVIRDVRLRMFDTVEQGVTFLHGQDSTLGAVAAHQHSA